MPNVASAIHCGRYDCGHITRSDDQAIKRALIIYLAREGGVPVDTTDDGADVFAVLGLMREGRPCSEVREWRVAGVRRADAPATPATTDGPAIPLSPQVLSACRMVAKGYDYPEAADRLYCSPETIKSHMARARKATNAHSAAAAIITLARWGLITL